LTKLASWVRATGAAAAALPSVSIAAAPVHAPVLYAVVAAVITAGVAAATASLTGTRALRPLGVIIVATCAWLLAQSSYAAAGLLVAPAVGAGVGMLLAPAPRWRDPGAATTAAGAVAVVVIARVAGGRDAAMALGALLAACGGLTAAIDGPGGWRPARREVALGAAASALVLITVAYAGATTPSATWFGSLEHHGPRDRNEVAVTFDDGPDPPYTLEIRDILDAHGVKGTFFEVGKAIDRRPDVSRALLDDGHLLGNHSYHHDAVSWLDPRYPELKSAQDAFRRNLGVCPALFRPPHGTHTPFMAHVVSDAGMTMVTWDVSAGDWATTDADLVARRVLAKVKPGSIILLHDGLDGNIGADRSVVVRALPMILDGLRARGLQAVTLDRLLGVPAYLDDC